MPFVLPPATPEVADCSWCGKEMKLLREESGFHVGAIQAYTAFYRIFGEEFVELREIARLVGFTVEDTELAIMEVADWLMANSPYRSLPRRCLVCDHAMGSEDLTHLKEPVLVS
jgi:hypothetical protein